MHVQKIKVVWCKTVKYIVSSYSNMELLSWNCMGTFMWNLYGIVDWTQNWIGIWPGS